MPQIFRRHRWATLLLMAGVILGILAYSVLFGAMAKNIRDMRTLLLLMVPAGIFASMFAAQYFRFAVLLLPIFALAVRFSFATGTESRVPASLALVLLLTTIWCASMYLRGWKLVPSPLNRPLLVFGAICIMSLFWGIIWRDPIVIERPTFIITQIGSLLTFLASISAALLIGNFVTTVRQLKYLVWVFLILLGSMTFTRIYGLPLRLNSGGLWGTWLVTILLGLIMVQPKLRWYWRLVLLVVLLMTLHLNVIVGSLWLSGWLPSIVAIFVVTFLHSRRAFFILLIVGALAFQTSTVRTFLEDVNQANVEEGSTSRLDIWERNLIIINDHWLLGTGPAGYAIYNLTYFAFDARSSHSNYFDIAAQFGIVGLGAWFWLSIVSVREGWGLIQRASPGFLRTLAIIATGGWICALFAMIFGDWVLPFAYNITISGFSFTVFSWIFLGTLISIRQLLFTEDATHCKELEAIA